MNISKLISTNKLCIKDTLNFEDRRSNKSDNHITVNNKNKLTSDSGTYFCLSPITKTFVQTTLDLKMSINKELTLKNLPGGGRRRGQGVSSKWAHSMAPHLRESDPIRSNGLWTRFWPRFLCFVACLRTF